jgi:hypothetical protein
MPRKKEEEIEITGVPQHPNPVNESPRIVVIHRRDELPGDSLSDG